MAEMTAAMQDMVNRVQCFIATADKNGQPNIGPKRSTRAVDAQTIMFAEVTGGRTYANLQENPVAAVAAVDVEQMEGYRFVGPATMHTSGALYDQVKQQLEATGLRAPKAVVTVQVEEIYSLSARQAGKRLA